MNTNEYTINKLLKFMRDDDKLKLYKIHTYFSNYDGPAILPITKYIHICTIPISAFLCALNNIGVLLKLNYNNYIYYNRRVIESTPYNLTLERCVGQPDSIYLNIIGNNIRECVSIIEVIKMLIKLDILKLVKGNDISSYSKLDIVNSKYFNTFMKEFGYNLEYIC